MQLSADDGVGEEALLDSGLDVRNDVGGEIGLVLARAHGQLADEEVQRLVGFRLGLYYVQQLWHQVGGERHPRAPIHGLLDLGVGFLELYNDAVKGGDQLLDVRGVLPPTTRRRCAT